MTTPITWSANRKFYVLRVLEQSNSFRGATQNTHSGTNFQNFISQMGHTRNRDFLIEDT